MRVVNANVNVHDVIAISNCDFDHPDDWDYYPRGLAAWKPHQTAACKSQGLLLC